MKKKFSGHVNSLKILLFQSISIYFQKKFQSRDVHFRVFPKNGTAKPAISWEVMELPAIPTEKPGQRKGGYVETNNTVN